MKKFSMFVVMAALALPALANVTVFSDNFNAEHSGTGVLNYASFANWKVSDGTVDLIGNGYYDFQPGYGLYVDMDGSTGNAGKMISSPAIELVAGNYKLSYDLAGNRRNTSVETVLAAVSIGDINASHSLTMNMPFATFSQQFTLAGTHLVTISFEGLGGDNIGMLLDNVKLERISNQPSAAVPAPGALLLSSLGTGLVGWLRRRKA